LVSGSSHKLVAQRPFGQANLAAHGNREALRRERGSRLYRRNRMLLNGVDQAQGLCTSGVHEADRLPEKAGRVTSLITSFLLNVVGLTYLPICSGKWCGRRRSKTKAKETVGENKVYAF